MCVCVCVCMCVCVCVCVCVLVQKEELYTRGQLSEWSLVGGGIPQRSALGLLFFLIYMNEIPSQLSHGRLLQYAYDTALICSGTDFGEVHQCLTECANSLYLHGSQGAR